MRREGKEQENLLLLFWMRTAREKGQIRLLVAPVDAEGCAKRERGLVEGFVAIHVRIGGR